MTYDLPPHLVDIPVTETVSFKHGNSTDTTTTTIYTSADFLDQDPSQPGHAILPSSSYSSKKRRPSKSKVPPEIRRSSSTPHMRNLALAAAGELSPTADKRRNKLGYHRTSVACGKQREKSAAQSTV
jgi:hypothetical protein